MHWQELEWPIPLAAPPLVFTAGSGDLTINPLHHRWRTHGLWSLHAFRWEGEVIVKGVALPVRPGHVSVTPPDLTMEYRLRGPAPQLYVLFWLPAAGAAAARPRPDIRAATRGEEVSASAKHWRAAYRLPPPGPGHTTVPIPAMQPLGNDFPALAAALEDVTRWHQSEPARASARLWSVLWQLAARHPAHTPQRGPPAPVQRVREEIEWRLGEVLYVPDLARRVELSPNHLTRLFRQSLGVTVVDYIRWRRVERARQLLQQSTMPIKQIAVAVGLPDLQHFNKVLRRALGNAPRDIRRTG